MPLVDKPLPELFEYRGRNPCPGDFDAYWSAALAELDATDPQPEMQPNPLLTTENIECFDLWFKGVGGARIYAKYIRPHEPLPGQIDRTFNFMRGL
jgi:cephalosporin-C deacetylase